MQNKQNPRAELFGEIWSTWSSVESYWHHDAYFQLKTFPEHCLFISIQFPPAFTRSWFLRLWFCDVLTFVLGFQNGMLVRVTFYDFWDWKDISSVKMAVLGREGFEIHWIYQPVPILWLCYESLENIWFKCKIHFNFKYDLMTRRRGVVWTLDTSRKWWHHLWTTPLHFHKS